MKWHAVTVLPGGRITIPADIRKSLDLQSGDTLTWSIDNGTIHFRKKPDDKADVPDTQKPAHPSITHRGLKE
ncbi:MAG TPA: AbrB/MazE/SpoVT family DNA-binding domain-containing protein [Thermomicrobiales bacterium]|nr:AbrB/MazE/SpoVT family DNA-binding domain-containing protein [Thermomicrobiales bacterium]